MIKVLSKALFLVLFSLPLWSRLLPEEMVSSHAPWPMLMIFYGLFGFAGLIAYGRRKSLERNNEPEK
ncbi:hypothetical protein [Shimia sediminis]|uniref:hypothetical protein n=1 Tax=Shimia sediminis TaxID=2497945 RepID=UPI00197F6117|nr:hypothetical protein [Shimia sediminis]